MNTKVYVYKSRLFQYRMNPNLLDDKGNPIDIDWSLGVVVKTDYHNDYYARKKSNSIKKRMPPRKGIQ